MTKEDILFQLKIQHKAFIDLINSLKEEEYMYSPAPQKWTIGQQVVHLNKSISPLVKALSLPPFVLALLFGKANRKSKNYTDLVAKYKLKLEAGGVAPTRFAPVLQSYQDKSTHLEKLLQETEKLCKQLNGFSEETLDRYILPHPLLGKLTLREMFYFTIYHVQHHQQIIQNYLKMKHANMPN